MWLAISTEWFNENRTATGYSCPRLCARWLHLTDQAWPWISITVLFLLPFWNLSCLIIPAGIDICFAQWNRWSILIQLPAACVLSYELFFGFEPTTTVYILTFTPRLHTAYKHGVLHDGWVSNGPLVLGWVCYLVSSRNKWQLHSADYINHDKRLPEAQEAAFNVSLSYV